VDPKGAYLSHVGGGKDAFQHVCPSSSKYRILAPTILDVTVEELFEASAHVSSTYGHALVPIDWLMQHVKVSALTMSIHCPLGIHTSAMYLTINPGSGAARVDMRRISSLPLDNWGEDLPSTLLLTLRDFLEHLSIKEMAFDPAWVSGYPGHSPVISVLKNDNTTEAVSLNPKQNWKLPMAETLTARWEIELNQHTY